MENFKEIETKWRKFWEEHPELYRADNNSKKNKKYILVEFPYPSGSGLHVGHAFSFTGGDVYARFKRMQGENVLFPMGWDAFGLPTENYAIKMKRKPQEVTKENTDMFRSQMKDLAFSFDWSREVNTTDPSYYKWTQWIFIQLFNKGLAYKKEMPINWCPSCKIGLANEEVVDGKCERCGSEVSRRNISQWVVKITDYADKLVEGLEETNFIEKVKQAQINWIGKSEGAKINFKIKGRDESLEIFTTRPDTLFGATFMVIAPEHELALEMGKNNGEIKNYIANARKKSDLERTELSKDKTGVFSGLYAINPATEKEIPIWISDFVLASYGTGAIMAVPAHDERDNAFAKKFGLEIVPVIEPEFGEIRENEEYKKRIVAVVYDPKTKKIITLDWGKKYGGRFLVGGGIEDGESLINTAKREVKEETGYINLKYIDQSEMCHHHYAALNKGVNRNGDIVGVYFELIDEEKVAQELTEVEKDKFKVEWMDVDKAVLEITDPLHNYLLSKFLLGKIYTNVDRGFIINSPPINGLTPEKAFRKMIKWLEDKKIGEASASYHLRDWIFSRQHYWGEPIPMVNCPKCGWVPVPEEQLPIVLPEVEAYEPTDDGKSPLSKIESFVKTKCPKCGGEAERETDTMPNWAGSDWYFLRYIDPHNDTVIASQELMKYWCPVDVYIGGDEHNVLHLLYSRFIYKFLWDLGVVPKEQPEPYYKRLSHGVILGPDNQRMSKSKGNVIVPEVVADKYGVDVVRMYMMFMGPFDATMAWNENTLMGVKRFLDRFEQFIKLQINQTESGTAKNREVKVILNKTIKNITDMVEQFKYNTAIAQMMEVLNKLTDLRSSMVDEDVKSLIKLLAPFAPYTAEELWSGLGNKTSVHVAEWPKADPQYLIEDEIIIMVSINGKTRSQLKINSAEKDNKDKILNLAKKDEKIIKWIGTNDIVKEIYIPGRMINFVVKE